MKIFKPLFLDDCFGTDIKVEGSWLIQAENEEQALQIAKVFFNVLDPMIKANYVPDKYTWNLVGVKEVIFTNGIYH